MFMKSKSSKRKFLSISVLILVFIVLFKYIFDHKQDFTNLLHLNIFYLVIIALLFVLFLFSNGLFLSRILSIFKIKIGVKEFSSLSIVNTLGNYLSFFSSGAVAKAIYLKRNYNLSYPEFIGSLAGNYIIVFFINSIAVLFSIVFIFLKQGTVNIFILFVFLFLFLLLSLFIIFSPRIPRIKKRFTEKVYIVIDSWYKIKRDRKLVLDMALISILNVFLAMFITYFEFMAIGMRIGLVECLFLSSVAGLSIIVNITPGSIGIKEGILIFSSSQLGISPSDIIMISIVDRALFAILALFLAPMATHYLINNKQEVNDAK